jgi:CheY-like chemotaxis protein
MVVVAAQDWQARALLRAQLLEEGLGVEADATVEEALGRLEASPTPPMLLIADISSSDDPSADVERLTLWAKRVPIWIIASRTASIPSGLEPRGFETVLFRPVDMGALVRQIKQRVEKAK